jgi:hypothetical protein
MVANSGLRPKSVHGKIQIVTPAKAGVQEILNSLHSGFRRNDG